MMRKMNKEFLSKLDELIREVQLTNALIASNHYVWKTEKLRLRYALQSHSGESEMRFIPQYVYTVMEEPEAGVSEAHEK